MTMTPLDAWHMLAVAVVAQDEDIIEKLADTDISFKVRPPGLSEYSTASGIPALWLDSDGIQPLAWVISSMLDLVKNQSGTVSSQGWFAQQAIQHGHASAAIGAGAVRAREYPAAISNSLESLAKIGGFLLSTDAEVDCRLGRTKMSAKAMDSLRRVLPDYARSFHAAANYRRMQKLAAPLFVNAPKPPPPRM